MKRVGAHVSASGGVSKAVTNAASINAKAFALFVKNQRQWFTKPFGEDEVDKFNFNLSKIDISKDMILPHGSYLINLGSPKEEGREKSIKSLIFELKLCRRLGIKALNVHPGSHLREISEEECLDKVAESVNIANKEVPEVKVVIENTAGQGSNIGYKLEHLSRIIEGVENKELVGVCIDTCHSFVAGYNLLSRDSSRAFFDEFVDKVGIEFLSGLHLNDSKTELGSKKDRHESLGKGYIGLEVFKYIMNSDYFEDIPLILETVDPSIWKEEIELLYSLVE
ncbi:MAG TPA: deoxyribonuclease IV [Fusobacteria bacterium]|nr:deoxyribonuclease IV [Fusobacteriota bacterium]|tara:strand:+ start:3278 stop:4120 length:843 start_codon:yes stop_codon:yes gene_type:complete